MPLRPDFEYAVVVLEGAVGIDGRPVRPGTLAYLGRGRDELALDVRDRPRGLSCSAACRSRTPIVMWWNFVARNRDEIDAAYASWRDQDDRFGSVRSALPRIPAGAPYWQQGPGDR